MPIHDYRYTEDSGYTEDFQAADAEAAAEYGRMLLRTGEWDPAGATLRLHATVTLILPSGEEDAPERVTVLLEPDEPACTNPAGHTLAGFSTAGSSHGVLVTQQCETCGRLKTLDTGATCHDCGEAYEQTSWQEPPQSSWEDFTWGDVDTAGIDTSHVHRQNGGGDNGEDVWYYHADGIEIIWGGSEIVGTDGDGTGYDIARYDWTGQPENSGYEHTAQEWRATVRGTLALVAEWASTASAAAQER